MPEAMEIEPAPSQVRQSGPNVKLWGGIGLGVVVGLGLLFAIHSAIGGSGGSNDGDAASKSSESAAATTGPTPRPTPRPTPKPTPEPTSAPTPAGKWPNNPIRGVSYGPMPLKTLGAKMKHDDFWEDESAAMWRDRGDLQIISSLGANAVRLYGNHALKNHLAFLDEAEELGLMVIPGMSDYPYTQMPENCLTTDLNCYNQVKASYTSNLKNGGFLQGRRYHPALRKFIVVNEPDLKLGNNNPKLYTKALLSAFDGVLDAEKEFGIDTTPEGNPLNFTIAFSFGVCGGCQKFKTKPALGQMWEFKNGVEHPDQYDYKPNNNLLEAFRTRFEFCFNAFNPHWSLADLFFNDYHDHFQGTPVFMGEYHNAPITPHPPDKVSQQWDVEGILKMTEGSLFTGISFFEFQVREDKGGEEMKFGMFKLGDEGEAFTLDGDRATAYCLSPTIDPETKENKVEALARAYGGRLDAPERSICKPSAIAV